MSRLSESLRLVQGGKAAWGNTSRSGFPEPFLVGEDGYARYSGGIVRFLEAKPLGFGKARGGTVHLRPLSHVGQRAFCIDLAK